MDTPSTIVPWLTLCLSIAGVVLVTGLRRGSLVSPMSVTLLMLTAIFGVRPIMMVAHDRYNFYGGNTVRNGFETAAWVGLLSVAFLLFGYFMGRITMSRRQRDTVSPPGGAPRLALTIPTAAVFSVGVLLAWLVLMAATGGGFAYVLLMFQGRGAGSETALAGMPAVVPALPVIAGLLMAFARITTQRTRRIRPGENLAYWIVIVLTIIPPSALGSRRFLLPSALAAVLGALPPQWYRLITWRMVTLALAGFLALSIIPFVRSSGSRTGRTDLLGAMGDYFGTQGLGGTLENFFLSYDTEMFSYIAFLSTRLGATIEYGLGRGTIGEALVTPAPSAFSLGERWSNEILIQAFGGPCGVSYCPVPSTSGIFFYDFGLPGVVLGMILVGILLSRFEENFLRAEGVSLLALLTLAAFVPQVVRGNSIAQLWIAAQVIIVLVVVCWLATRIGRVPHRDSTAKDLRAADRIGQSKISLAPVPSTRGLEQS
ncbi:O-antigen polymerase [Microbacterium thalli]|uniref:O-antigen polymerase n=1 Tax=Microbacterium thalli TaxID=3027921 RepID=UPI0023658728|nr:O-antigen polymerase [Microbacterium thalli]MDD7930678.1 O-antigen ligase [Microbacterium thalli]